MSNSREGSTQPLGWHRSSSLFFRKEDSKSGKRAMLHSRNKTREAFLKGGMSVSLEKREGRLRDSNEFVKGAARS